MKPGQAFHQTEQGLAKNVTLLSIVIDAECYYLSTVIGPEFYFSQDWLGKYLVMLAAHTVVGQVCC